LRRKREGRRFVHADYAAVDRRVDLDEEKMGLHLDLSRFLDDEREVIRYVIPTALVHES
jgi:hypothetical protein